MGKRNLEVTLTLAGGPGEGFAKIQKAIDDHPLRNRILQTGFVTDEQRKNLFSQPGIFLYPSLYEGFGFPPLEAARQGWVPLVAGGTAPAEFLPVSEWKIDLQNPSSLLQVLFELQQTPQKKILESLSQTQASLRHLTWKTAAEKYFEVYQSLVKDSGDIFGQSD